MSLVNEALRKRRRSNDSDSESTDGGDRTWIEPSIAPSRRRRAATIWIVAAGVVAVGAAILYVLLFRADRGGPRQALAMVPPATQPFTQPAAGANVTPAQEPIADKEPVLPPPAQSGQALNGQNVAPPKGVQDKTPTLTVAEPPAPVAPPPVTVRPPQPPQVVTPQPTVTLPPPSPSGIEPQGVYVSRINFPGVTQIKLDAIIWSADNPVALMNGTAITPNTVLGNVRVTAIESRRVTLTHGGTSFYLRLP